MGMGSSKTKRCIALIDFMKGGYRPYKRKQRRKTN